MMIIKWHSSLLIVKGINYNLVFDLILSLKCQFQNIISGGAILYETLHTLNCRTPLNHNAKIGAYHVPQIRKILKFIVGRSPVLWDKTLCSLLKVNWHVRGTFYQTALHHIPEDSTFHLSSTFTKFLGGGTEIENVFIPT
jgi:hypothetical protein